MSSKEGRSYAADYYKRHREEITARKRERYRTDPEYRSKVLDTKRKEMRRRKLLEGGKQDYVGAPKGTKMLLVVNDKSYVTEMFTVTQLCQRSGIKRPVLHSWEKDGWMPRPSYLNSRGHMVYTEHEFFAIHKAIVKRRFMLGQKALKFRADDQFKDMIKNIYDGLHMGLPKSYFEDNEGDTEDDKQHGQD